MEPVVALALMLAKEAVQSKVAHTMLTQLLKTMTHNQFLKSFVNNLQKLNAKVGLEHLGADLATQQQNQNPQQKKQQNQKTITNQLLTLSKQVGHNHLVLYFAQMFVQNLQQLQKEHPHEHKPAGPEAKSDIDIEGNDITGLSDEEAEKLVNDLGTWMANPKDNPNPMAAYVEATKEMNDFSKYVDGLPEELSENQVRDVFKTIDQKAEKAAKYVYQMQPEPEVAPEKKRRGPLDLPRAGDALKLNPYDKG